MICVWRIHFPSYFLRPHHSFTNQLLFSYFATIPNWTGWGDWKALIRLRLTLTRCLDSWRCDANFRFVFSFYFFFVCAIRRCRRLSVSDVSRVCKLIDEHVRCGAAAHNTETLTMIHHSQLQQITFLFDNWRCGGGRGKTLSIIAKQDPEEEIPSQHTFLLGFLFLFVILILRRFVYHYVDFY